MAGILDAYLTPPSVTDGIWINLEKVNASFRVRLPSEHNRAYKFAVMMRARVEMLAADAKALEETAAAESNKGNGESDGEAKEDVAVNGFDITQMAAAEIVGFVETCVFDWSEEIKAERGKFTDQKWKKLANEAPALVDELFVASLTAAKTEADALDDTKKKPSNS